MLAELSPNPQKTSAWNDPGPCGEAWRRLHPTNEPLPNYAKHFEQMIWMPDTDKFDYGFTEQDLGDRIYTPIEWYCVDTNAAICGEFYILGQPNEDGKLLTASVQIRPDDETSYIVANWFTVEGCLHGDLAAELIREDVPVYDVGLFHDLLASKITLRG